MKNPVMNFPSTDKFEAVAFDSSGIEGEGLSIIPVPKVTFRPSNGFLMSMDLKASAAEFEKLAEWATEIAAILTALNRP